MPEKRKIVIIGSAYPLRGGLSAYNERLARAYLQKGDDVTLYTFSLQYPSILFPGKTQYSTDPAPADLDIRVKVNSVNPLNWIWVGQEIRDLKPDLVLIKFWIPFMAPCLGTIARIIRKNKHSKIISIIDNIIPHEKRPGDHWLGKYWVKSVDGFVVMSNNVLDDLDTFDKSKPKIFCPHPLYDHFGETLPKKIARQSLSLEGDGKYILFFGFIRDYKGLDLLLNAMADERIQSMKIKLLVAGEFYTNSKPYFDIISQHNLAECVVMTGDFIPDSDVSKYFSACDMVVQPYKDATQSGVTQIAYHFNKPMITTNVGGLAEIVPDGKVGYVIKPDSKEIAEAIIKFYTEEKETEFTGNVKIEKEKYSWERMTETIDKLLLEPKTENA
jgi:D-inositol-3-phosphate glycosyltransferase